MKYSPSTKGFYPDDIHYPNPPSDLIDVTDAEAEQARQIRNAGGTLTVVNGQLVATALDQATLDAHQQAIQWQQVKTLAKAALGQSDTVIIRCAEHGVPVPQDWRDYRAALRAVVAAASGDASAALPAPPAYPAGT